MNSIYFVITAIMEIHRNLVLKKIVLSEDNKVVSNEKNILCEVVENGK